MLIESLSEERIEWCCLLTSKPNYFMASILTFAAITDFLKLDNSSTELRYIRTLECLPTPMAYDNSPEMVKAVTSRPPLVLKVASISDRLEAVLSTLRMYSTLLRSESNSS